MFLLLTGGSACGKSTYAEEMVLKYGKPRFYVATMRPYGDESLSKIARHRKMRAEKGFETIEKQTDVQDIELPAGSTVLLECICNLTSNEMFDAEGNMTDVRQKVIDSVLSLVKKAQNTVVVTNEVGAEYQDYGDLTPEYVKAIGDINRALASAADNVYEMVCGIPIVLKGELL
ncbi:MAG: bifunctional adenosylcobinamide kinase/adenosylcobinamide-phosphate guanylyltransferase [Coriobacteriales bacterium]|jgi:adenosylcobinamide kinase/adenosylcobinamide-phosphate guanylyltransferase